MYSSFKDSRSKTHAKYGIWNQNPQMESTWTLWESLAKISTGMTSYAYQAALWTAKLSQKDASGCARLQASSNLCIKCVRVEQKQMPSYCNLHFVELIGSPVRGDPYALIGG